MHPSTLVLFVACASAYTPSAANWSTPINTRNSKNDYVLQRNIANESITSVEQLIYDIDVKLGNQDVKLLVDSGSFSLWTATPDYLCTSYAADYAQSYCGIVGSYEPTTDPNAINLTDIYYDESYGSGFATGQAWNTTVTVAGLEVPNYSIGYADTLLNDAGDQVASGIIGLGIGTATGFYYQDPSSGGYAPAAFFERLKEKLSAWQFAITFGQGISNGGTDRSNTGLLSFGGLDPSMGNFTSSDFVTLNISSQFTKTGYSYWGGWIDGFTYINGSGLPSPLNTYDVLVDSGTAYMIVSPAIFTGYNSLWTPNSTFVPYDNDEAPGYYYIDCNATAPDFSVVVNGSYITIPSSDLIYRTVNGTCRSSVVEGVNTPNLILGTPIFKSNVIVFDGDEKAIHFGQKPRK